MTNHKNDISLSWVLRSYVDSRGKLILAAWFDDLADNSQADVLTKLEYLVAQPRDKWVRPDFDLLHGSAKGFGEIRIKIRSVRTGLIGFFGPSRQEFAIVLSVQKKGNNYKPKDWESVANKRKREIENDENRAAKWVP